MRPDANALGWDYMVRDLSSHSCSKRLMPHYVSYVTCQPHPARTADAGQPNIQGHTISNLNNLELEMKCLMMIGPSPKPPGPAPRSLLKIEGWQSWFPISSPKDSNRPLSCWMLINLEFRNKSEMLFHWGVSDIILYRCCVSQSQKKNRSTRPHQN